MDFSDPRTTFALHFAESASRVAERIRRDVPLHTQTKRDLSPVTLADYAVQALAGALLERYNDPTPLVAEEEAASLQTAEAQPLIDALTDVLRAELGEVTPADILRWIGRGGGETAERFWTLDPIDGTKGYVRGGQYATALAEIVEGTVEFGLLICPRLQLSASDAVGVLCMAQRGKGAWRRPLEGPPSMSWEKLQVSPCRNIQDARLLRSLEAGHTDAEAMERIAAALSVRTAPVLMDSQAKAALLAAGEAELLFRLLSPQRPDYKELIWDQAAAALLVEEAGGKVTDITGAPLDFSVGRRLMRNRGVFASNGYLHEDGLRALRAVGAIGIA